MKGSTRLLSGFRVSLPELATTISPWRYRKSSGAETARSSKAFIAFRSHYLFESHFSMPRHPQEQGRVESLVGYMRRNYFVPVPQVNSFEELNCMLLERLRADDRRPVEGKEISIGEAWEQEKGKLLAFTAASLSLLCN